MDFRQEFRVKNLGFTGSVPIQRFFVFHWRSPGLLYVVYRVLAAAYCLTWLIYTTDKEDGKLPSYAFLTTWTYTLETIYFITHALFAIIFYLFSYGRNSVGIMERMTVEEHSSLFPEIRGNQNNRANYEEIPTDETQAILDSSSAVLRPNRTSWYACLIWIFLNCTSTAAIMVTIIFWAVLVPLNTNVGTASLANLQLHLFNTILILIEMCLTAVPIRVLHVIYPIIYGTIYILFSAIYWAGDHNRVMYDILDWNKPGLTMGCILAIAFLIIPIIHLLIYMIYRLKLKIFKSYCL